MKRRNAALLLAALLGMFLLAGCQSGETAKDPQENGSGGSEAELATDHSNVNDFSAVLLDGTETDAAGIFEGKDVTAINIWATWCPPCVGELEALGAYAKTLPENLQLIGLCLDGAESAEAAAQLLEEKGCEFLNIKTADGDMQTLISEIQYVPTTVFVDEEGNMLTRSIEGAAADIEAVYDEYFDAALKAAGKTSEGGSH